MGAATCRPCTPKDIENESDPVRVAGEHILQDNAAYDDTADLPPNKELGLLDNCILVLPEVAVRVYGLVPNMDDKGDSQKTMWLGRVWQLRALNVRRYRRQVLQKPIPPERMAFLEEILKDPKKRDTAQKIQAIWRGRLIRSRSTLNLLEPLSADPSSHVGTVLFMHGSGGMTYNNVRYARKLARMGFLVIAPDSMAGGEYRSRSLAGLIKPDDPTPYWDDLGLYESSAEGVFHYSTKAEAVIADPERFRELYANVFRLRRAEMHWILGRMPVYMRVRGVFTMGQSEGAMTVARFDDQRYGKMIRGRIVSAYSVEHCYFSPTPKAGEFGGSLAVPTLNIIGDMDQFFGPIDSVAKSVFEYGSYGGDKLTGNAFENMKRQGMEHGIVTVLDGAYHDPSETHDNFLRDILRVFLAAPGMCQHIPDVWKPDKYLSQKCKVVERHGNCLLMKVGKMEFPSNLSYYREVLKRQAHQGYFGRDDIEEGGWNRCKAYRQETQNKSKKIIENFKKGPPPATKTLETAYCREVHWSEMRTKKRVPSTFDAKRAVAGEASAALRTTG